jgi:hypothetical protein
MQDARRMIVLTGHRKGYVLKALGKFLFVLARPREIGKWFAHRATPV